MRHRLEQMVGTFCHLLVLLPPLMTGFQQTKKDITFQVIPNVMPDTSGIFITGDHEKLGAWNPGLIALQKQPDGSWMRTFSFPPDTELEYKITRGDWQTEAVSEEGTVLPNSRYTVSKDDTVAIEIENWKDLAHEIVGQIIGDVSYHRDLKGDGIKPRDVIVWLPPGYRTTPGRRYPVLYMHDGQNIIDPKTAYSHVDWQVDEVADSLIGADQMEEIIMVGIYNTDHRVAEYSLTEKGKAYMSFVIHDLKPLIDNTYRTLPDRKHTAVMGSSMGGLLSFLMVWQYSDIFSMAGCLSPAFVHPYDYAVDMVKRYHGPVKPIKLYIDNGGVGLDARLQPGCEAMLAALKDKGFKIGENLQWFHDVDAEHSERAWAKRVWRPLLFMFGKK